MRPLLLCSICLLLAGLLWRLKLRLCSADESKSSQGRAALALLCTGIVLLIWTFTIHVEGAMRLGYVDSAIGTLRNIAGNEEAFANAHPEGGFTCDFADFTDEDVLRALADNALRNGYRFQLRGCTQDNKRPRYQAFAIPVRKEMPIFCTDESGILRTTESTSADVCLTQGVPL